MRLRQWLLCFCTALIVAAPAGAQETGRPPVLQAMKEELSRSLKILGEQPTPPYFLSYEITQIHSAGASGSFGTVVSSGENRSRQLDIDLRVGDYTMDNTHPVRGRFRRFGRRFSFVQVPLDDDPDAIRGILWFYTDQKYKQAVEQLTRVKTNVRVTVEQEDRSDDFSREASETYTETPLQIAVDLGAWEEKVRKYSAPFAGHSEIYQARASISATAETRWFVDSGGAEVQTSKTHYRLTIIAFTKADDGMELPRYESFFAFTPEGLPEDEAVLQAVDRMIADLKALRTAPIVEPYTGPAILSGRASGVFFHEVFGHRIEGHRQKREEEGQTFKKKVDEKILPEAFSVFFDPTLRRLGETDLVGAYRYDNQGVRARRVDVIEEGVFRRFLMSRSPIEGFPNSNGHGRKQPGYGPVARQSNLIVEVSESVSRARLKQMLIAQMKRENKPFGLFFEDIQGGFTITGRTIPNAFNVLPIMVYRITPDGEEELVRGVDLIGTPLTAFSMISAADNEVEVFNGVCGAESGGVPVSAVSPGILISQIEVQKKEKSQARPPILPPPFENHP